MPLFFFIMKYIYSLTRGTFCFLYIYLIKSLFIFYTLLTKPELTNEKKKYYRSRILLSATAVEISRTLVANV